MIVNTAHIKGESVLKNRHRRHGFFSVYGRTSQLEQKKEKLRELLDKKKIKQNKC